MSVDQGFAVMPNWLVRTRDVGLHDKMVYLVLASHVTRDGEWYMTHSEIASEAGMSVSVVQRALLRLKVMGLISWRGRQDPATGARLGNAYRVYSTLGQSDRPPRSEIPTPPVRDTEHKKNPEEEPIDTPPTPSAADHHDAVVEEFEGVWNAWPKKNAKQAAFKKWSAMSPKLRQEVIPLLVAHGNAHRAHTPIEFVPYLSTWLNQQRWTDPLAEPRAGQAPAKPTRKIDPRKEWMYR